jgi:hypothetical protein
VDGRWPHAPPLSDTDGWRSVSKKKRSTDVSFPKKVVNFLWPRIWPPLGNFLGTPLTSSIIKYHKKLLLIHYATLAKTRYVSTVLTCISSLTARFIQYTNTVVFTHKRLTKNRQVPQLCFFQIQSSMTSATTTKESAYSITPYIELQANAIENTAAILRPLTQI